MLYIHPYYRDLVLATHCWNAGFYSDRCYEKDGSKTIDQSILKVFILDEYELETFEKESILSEALENPDQMIRIRQAAACLTGMRGDLRAIPILDETIRIGDENWKSRAVNALSLLGDERCIPLPGNALTMDRDKLHRATRRALIGMDKLEESNIMLFVE